jgi:hypothetical protein
MGFLRQRLIAGAIVCAGRFRSQRLARQRACAAMSSPRYIAHQLLLDRRDARQGGVLRAWLDHRVIIAFAGRTFPITTTIARVCARLHVPDPRPGRADHQSLGTPLIRIT